MMAPPNETPNATPSPGMTSPFARKRRERAGVRAILLSILLFIPPLFSFAADYSDGVLSLIIPVAEEAKPRKIAVGHTGSATQIEGSVEADA